MRRKGLLADLLNYIWPSLSMAPEQLAGKGADGPRERSYERRGKSPPSRETQGRRPTLVENLFVGGVALALFIYAAPKLPPWRTIYNLVLPPDVSGNQFTNPLLQLVNPDTFLSLALVLLLIRVLVIRGRRAARDAGVLSWVAIFMIGGGLLSTSNSIYPGVSLAQLIGRSAVILLAISVLYFEPDLRQVQVWISAFVLGVALIMFYGLLVFYQTYGIPTSLSSVIRFHTLFTTTYVPYSFATFGNPAQVQEVVQPCLALCLTLGFSNRFSKPQRVLYLGSSVLLLANMFIAFERWAFVTMFITALLLLWRHGRRGRRSGSRVSLWLGGGLLALALVVAVSDPTVVQYFRAATDPTDPNNSLLSRLDTWNAGLLFIFHHPEGAGLGMTLLQSNLPTVPHNLFIGQAAAGGLLTGVGLLIWTAWIVFLFWRVAQERTASLRADLAFGLLLASVALIVYTVVQDSPMYAYGIGIWTALVFVFPVLGYAVLGLDYEHEPRSLEPARLSLLGTREKGLTGTII